MVLNSFIAAPVDSLARLRERVRVRAIRSAEPPHPCLLPQGRRQSGATDLQQRAFVQTRSLPNKGFTFERCFCCFALLLVFIGAIPLSLPAQEKLITIGFTNPTGAAALPFVMAEKRVFLKKKESTRSP